MLQVDGRSVWPRKKSVVAACSDIIRSKEPYSRLPRTSSPDSTADQSSMVSADDAAQCDKPDRRRTLFKIGRNRETNASVHGTSGADKYSNKPPLRRVDSVPGKQAVNETHYRSCKDLTTADEPGVGVLQRSMTAAGCEPCATIPTQLIKTANECLVSSRQFDTNRILPESKLGVGGCTPILQRKPRIGPQNFGSGRFAGGIRSASVKVSSSCPPKRVLSRTTTLSNYGAMSVSAGQGPGLMAGPASLTDDVTALPSQADLETSTSKVTKTQRIVKRLSLKKKFSLSSASDADVSQKPTEVIPLGPPDPARVREFQFKNMGQEPQRVPSPRPPDLTSSSQLFHVRSPEDAVEELEEDTAQAGGQLRHADIDNWPSHSLRVSRPQPGYETQVEPGYEPRDEPGYEPQTEPRHEPGYEPRLDSSYKAVRTAADSDSVPSTPVLGHRAQQDSSSETTTSTSRISSFFSKRSLKGNPLKRTKSVTKLERKRYAPDNEDPLPSVPTSSRLRSSRSHESLLSNHSVVSGSDVSSSCLQQQQVSVKPLHSSILGQQHCIQISSASGTRYYSCRSAEERDRWIHSLRCTVQPNRERMRRVDNSLRIWILEAKSVSQKKRYFCELYLDDTLYARTTSKHKQELCFWGEIFDFGNLPAVQTIQVHLYREADKRRKKEKNVLVGVVTIPVSAVNSRFFVEKWYPICAEKAASGKPTPSLRVKCRFQAVDILPLSAYREFLQYISCRYRPLCEFLEPLLGVKYKEDIAAALVCIMQREGLAKHLLAELVIMDVNKVDDERLTFRGNSLATKATESFMRLVGERYLSDTLGDPIRRLLETGADLEVDPLKVSSSSALQKQRQNLRNAVQEIWNAILASYNNFPRELRDCFHMISERLKEAGKSEQRENVVSSCIFLRFFCPAILSPSLFGLVQEYPDEKCVRNLTLVAKTLQTLANFTQFQGKESYMEFLNDFIIKEAQTMKSFLRKITYNTPSSREPSSVQQEWDGVVDLGKQLSLLHGFLRECVAMVTSSEHLVERQRLDAALNSVTEAQRRADGGQQHSPPPPPSTTVAPPPTSYLSLQRNMARNAVDGSRSTPTAVAGAAMLGVSSMPVPYQRHRPPLLTSSTVDALPAADPAVSEKASTLPRHALLTSRARDEYGAGVGLQQRVSVGGHQHQPHFHSHQTPAYPTTTGTRGRTTAESNEQDASGSQMSISQLSTVASSGYQSFAASYSQSSSPVDPVIGRSKVSRCSPPGPRTHRRQDVGTAHQHPPLAFNNPMYQLNSNKGIRPSNSGSLSSTQSMDDVQLTLAPSIPCRLLPRSSSSSPSPPRERRVTVPPRITPRAAPPPPPVEPPADALARTRRLKTSRRTSADILSARRQQLRDSDTDSSPELRTARAKNKNRRSRVPDKTFDEYEEEIRALQCQMEQLQSRLDEEIRPAASAQQQHQCLNSGAPINEILNRLSAVEGELRREQGQMTCVLSEKERVIMAQSRRIQELNVANSRLHTALATLQDRTPVPPAAAAPLTGTAAGAAVSDTSDYKSSSC